MRLFPRLRAGFGFAVVLVPTFLWADPAPPARGQAEHVVVVVWDGMRPDFVRPDFTTNLCRLMSQGVLFANHHSVYISSTEVNGTAIATGAYPDRSGIIANRDFRPEIDGEDSLGTESIEAIRRGDTLSGGHYLEMPTIAEIVQQAGFPTAVAGTKPVALLQDRSDARVSRAALDSVMLHNGHSIPSNLVEVIIKEEKDFPAASIPNAARDAWTTKALTQTLWSNGVPKFSLLWLSEPDASQHASSPGSEDSISAMVASDKNLGLVLKTLEEKGVRDKTDVFVVSDHGFSTVQRRVNVIGALNRAKFKAGSYFYKPENGNILVVGLGGTVMLYVINHDKTVVQALVRFLQASDFAGVIFSRDPMEGTFPIDQVHLQTSKTAPDVIVSLRWTADRNRYGIPGMLTASGGRRGKGNHASLSPFDMHNTLVASGPDFRRTFVNRLPTGNADLAPTILQILGIKQPGPMDGRVLQEAFKNSPISAQRPVTTVLRAHRELETRYWDQYLKLTRMGEQIYFDAGNGQSVLK